MIGNVRKKPGKNGWEWRGVIEDELGRKKRISTYAPTREEALEKAAKVIGRAKTGQPIRDNRQKVSTWLLHWSEYVLPTTTRAVNTQASYAGLIRLHLAPALSGVTLAELRPTTLSLVLSELEGKGLSASSRRSAYAALNAALGDAVNDRLLARNPMESVKRPKAGENRSRVVEVDKVKELIAATKGHRYFPMLAVAIETGLRRGEVLALEWSDINLEDFELEVTGTLVRLRNGQGLVKTPPKSTTSRRRVPFSGVLAAELKKHRAQWLEHRLLMGSTWGESPNGSGYAFLSSTGNPVEPRSFSRWYSNQCEKLGIQETGIHSLRHAAATGWLSEGTDARTVAELLGHSDGGALALRVYASSNDERRRRAVEERSRKLGYGK